MYQIYYWSSSSVQFVNHQVGSDNMCETWKDNPATAATVSSFSELKYDIMHGHCRWIEHY